MIECKHFRKKHIIFEIILCILLKVLLLTNATAMFSPDVTPNSFQEEHSHVSKFYTRSRLSKPTSLRSFVEFNQFVNKSDNISMTLRWNRPKFIDEGIQGYTAQYWYIDDLNGIKIYADKNVTTVLEYTMHNLKPNTTYYFLVRAYTKVAAGPYTDLINVSTAHENPIPQLLITTIQHERSRNIHSIDVWDLDSNTIINLVKQHTVVDVTYSVAEHRIYWSDGKNIMTLDINENNITKLISVENYKNHIARSLCIDWVARYLYWKETNFYYDYIMKLDLTMWENGVVKYEKILKTSKLTISNMNILPSMGILYMTQRNKTTKEYNIVLLDLDEKTTQIIQKNASNVCTCSLNMSHFFDIKIENTEKPLFYLLFSDSLIVADISICNCNVILQAKDIGNEIYFHSLRIDMTNIYISSLYNFKFVVLKKKHALLESKDNALKYVQVIKQPYLVTFYTFRKSLQTYPSTRCLVPDERVYTIEIVTATENSIIVNLPDSVPKSGCKKYNLPTTIYTIYVSHCSDNKTEKFTVQTHQRYYEIQNLTPLTEYKLTLTLSNFYFDRLSMNPFGSNVIQSIKTKPGKLNAPENVTVQALTPTVAAVNWMPPKKLNCAAVIYKVYWKSIISTSGLQEKGEKFVGVPKRLADGRFFTIIQLSLPVQDYLTYVRAHPANFSDFYNDSLSKIIHTYSEPNDITLSEANVNSMRISWISNIERDLKVFCALEYENVTIEKWETTDFIKTNYNEETVYLVKNLQPRTSYKFRLILRYPEYEEIFTWPSDERFIFSTLDDIGNTPGVSTVQNYLILILGLITVVCVCYSYYLYRQRNGDNKRRNTNECVLSKIKREQITLTKYIGNGSFGMMFQGKMRNFEKSEEVPVAIKMLQKDASSYEKKKFLKEAKLMNHFRHKHVLRLLAVCLNGESPVLVLELMETDLLKYLRDCEKLETFDSNALYLQDLLAMCEDVARGCCYLEELSFVHGDLSCRNCLVSARDRENRIVKIGNFRLARNTYDGNYRKEGEDLEGFPIRWMAPESLTSGILTSQNDVWSFGVLMWEITSLGEQPYAAKSNAEVINYVHAGGRLPMPLNCPSTLYQLMQSCWSAEDVRPNFKRCLTNIVALRKGIENVLLSSRH